MTGSAVGRMRNFQILLFCSADVVSMVLNGAILILLIRNKKTRTDPSNPFFISIIFFQLVTALCAINFAARFVENDAEDLRKDTVIVQITFTLIGLGLHHFMLAIDRIILLKNQERYPLIMEGKLTWIMIALSWFIPSLIAIVSSCFASDGDPTSQVSYALAIITIASGLTLFISLFGLNALILKRVQAMGNRPLTSTRRLRRSVVRSSVDLLPCRISTAMAVAYVTLLFPQILFAFGKLLKTRGLLDMWFMQLASTIMLCSGIVHAALYIYMNKNIRVEFSRAMKKIRGKEEQDETKKDVMRQKSTETDNDSLKMDTLLLKNSEKKADIELAFL